MIRKLLIVAVLLAGAQTGAYAQSAGGVVPCDTQANELKIWDGPARENFLKNCRVQQFRAMCAAAEQQKLRDGERVPKNFAQECLNEALKPT